MKNNPFNIIGNTAWGSTFFILLCTLVLNLSYKTTFAQEKKDSVAKLSFSMKLSPVLSNGIRTVKVKVSRKENKKIIYVADLKSPIQLYLNEVKETNAADGTGWIGKIQLNNEGEGIFYFPSKFNALTSGLHTYTFIAKMESDPRYEDAEEEITVADAKINLDYAGEDSVKSASAVLLGWKDSAYVPVSAAELKLCIKRTFNFLDFGEAGVATDENGKVSGVVPADIPGNANRTLTIAARMEDDETYGSVEVTKDVPWAILPKTNPVRGRTLWSSGDNAPLLLVVTALTIIALIWGTIFYLVALLFKIKRLGKTL